MASVKMRNMTLSAAALLGQLRNDSEPGSLMGVRSPVLLKARDVEERKCGFVEHFNPESALMKCNCTTCIGHLERNQLSVFVSFSATSDSRMILSLNT